MPVLEEISEQQEAPVIIAGMGRYGQIIARVLIAQGYNCTVLDHDAEMIEAARRFGYRVFYGDATRLDLLRTAGIAKAKLLVVAVDDVEQSLAVVDLVNEHYPDLPLVARARDVTHWNQLRDRGVMLVQREMFESSLASARSVLEILGQRPRHPCKRWPSSANTTWSCLNSSTRITKTAPSSCPSSNKDANSLKNKWPANARAQGDTAGIDPGLRHWQPLVKAGLSSGHAQYARPRPDSLPQRDGAV